MKYAKYINFFVQRVGATQRPLVSFYKGLFIYAGGGRGNRRVEKKKKVYILFLT